MNGQPYIDGIVARLREVFEVPVYTERAEQDFIVPCFAVESGRTGQTPIPNGQYFRETEYIVTYYPVSGVRRRQECLEVMETLFCLLETVPLGENARARGLGLRGEVLDDVLHFFVKFRAVVRKKEVFEKMDNLEVKGALK